MAVEPSTGPLKVFLWTTGRSLSNAILKCMTYVPNTIAWHEPYSKIGKFSDVVESSPIDAESEPVRMLVKKLGGASAVAKIESGYDASDKDYDWLKEQLESDLPDGKSMLFVKDNGAIIGRLALHDKIPKGFRHTFLIRNPNISIMSRLKMYLKIFQAKSVNLPGGLHETPFLQFNEYLNALWKYVKDEELESRPVIIDVDDLLENPKEIIEAYCKEIGIPFTENLLTWPAGDDVMTNLWIVPKQSILVFRILGFGDKAFAHTEFKKLPVSAFDGSSKDDEFLKQIPSSFSISSENVKEIIDREMPYYEEMYSKRLTLNK
ncbi:uncharacterized protein [Amphiura filiformis]|uniref:uncharacterized protein n=1 Tax=Amphiura filiformis TaxID=82378 RepID=UPI003B21C51F